MEKSYTRMRDGYYVISDLNKTSQNKVEAKINIKVTGFETSGEVEEKNA